MRKSLTILFAIICLTGVAQYKYTALCNPSWRYANDSIEVPEVEKPKKEKHTKFLFSIDSRNSGMQGQWVKIGGVRVGLEFSERYRFGIGLYEMPKNETIEMNEITLKSGEVVSPILQNFTYVAWFTEYLFHHDFRWTAGVMMSHGRGNAEIRIKDMEGGIDSVHKINKIPIFAVNLNGYYHVTPWLAPGMGFGYRWVRGDDERLKQGFEAPFYVIKVKFMIGRLFKCIFKREQIQAEREEYKAERARKKAERGAEVQVENNDSNDDQGTGGAAD